MKVTMIMYISKSNQLAVKRIGDDLEYAIEHTDRDLTIEENENSIIYKCHCTIKEYHAYRRYLDFFEMMNICTVTSVQARLQGKIFVA